MLGLLVTHFCAGHKEGRMHLADGRERRPEDGGMEAVSSRDQAEAERVVC